MDAPDPKQELISNGAWMAKLDSYFLCVFAVSTRDLQKAQHVLASHGIKTQTSCGERLAPDGRRFAWDYLVQEETRFGIALPHIMSWTTKEHPSANSPSRCKLVSFEVKHPEAEALRSLYSDLNLDIAVYPSQAIALELTVEGPKGRFTLPTSCPSWGLDLE
jgi:hypothetical protein